MAPPAINNKIARAINLYGTGEYEEARSLFRSVARFSQQNGAERSAAMNWNNAGACSVNLMQYGPALADFARAEKVEQSSRQTAARANTLNNLANLYLHTGQPENAMRAATEGLQLPVAEVNPRVRAKIRFQLASALMELKRFEEAKPIYLLSVNELLDEDDLASASRELGLIGMELLTGDRLEEAEWALSEGLRLARIHHLDGAGNILRGLGQLRSAQNDLNAATILFDAALAAPGLTPRWEIFRDRGLFRLRHGDLEGALPDFREARRLAFQVRADIVPADQDRVALEGGLSKVLEGLVDAGNRLAAQTGETALLRETFDAAEQDRLWSLRALLPGEGDWRTRLPDHYWELLARYQSLERASINGLTSDVESKVAGLKLEMHQIEASAAGPDVAPDRSDISPLIHVQQTLGLDDILFSFHVTETSSWLWAVDQSHIKVFRLPPAATLRAEVAQFAGALRNGDPATELGRHLFRSLFGQVPEGERAHKHWLLEPDGPLYDLPFAALVTDMNALKPVYLIENAALQSIPSALLLERGTIRGDGEFLGIGDAVYNRADPRFKGGGGESELTLPRLPNTIRELRACARAWGPGRSILLEGNGARIQAVQSEIRKNPAVIHFATHVVASGGDFRSGLIALSLGSGGEMGLLGPREIVARPVGGSVVVMDGCHSSRGEALPSAGLMGLTRAWIGAGARAVVATEWDLPDEAAQSLMANFYTSLQKYPERGLAEALRGAQLAEINLPNGRLSPGKWAGYFLLSRI